MAEDDPERSGGIACLESLLRVRLCDVIAGIRTFTKHFTAAINVPLYSFLIGIDSAYQDHSGVLQSRSREFNIKPLLSLQTLAIMKSSKVKMSEYHV